MCVCVGAHPDISTSIHRYQSNSCSATNSLTCRAVGNPRLQLYARMFGQNAPEWTPPRTRHFLSTTVQPDCIKQRGKGKILPRAVHRSVFSFNPVCNQQQKRRDISPRGGVLSGYYVSYDSASSKCITPPIFYVAHVSTVPEVGVGKERRRKNWSMVIPEKAAPVIGTTLRTTDPAPADSRQGTPSVSNCVTR